MSVDAVYVSTPEVTLEQDLETWRAGTDEAEVTFDFASEDSVEGIEAAVGTEMCATHKVDEPKRARDDCSIGRG